MKYKKKKKSMIKIIHYFTTQYEKRETTNLTFSKLSIHHNLRFSEKKISVTNLDNISDLFL